MRGEIVATGALLGAILGGCAGDGLVEESHEGALSDGDPVLRSVDASRYDVYAFSTHEGFVIQTSLRSTDFDAYVHLVDDRGNQIAYNDDAKPGMNHASIEITAPYSGKYYVLANSRDAEELGDYELEIRATPQDAR